MSLRGFLIIKIKSYFPRKLKMVDNEMVKTEEKGVLTFVMKQITSFPKKDKGVNSVYFPRLKMLSDVMLK